MGLNTAIDLAENIDITLEQAIGMHLQTNHYPPVPLTMVQTCIDAIDAYYEEDYHRDIELPEGVSWRGNTTAPASAIVDAHHLSPWLPEEEY